MQGYTVAIGDEHFTFSHPIHQPGGESYDLLRQIISLSSLTLSLLRRLADIPSSASTADALRIERDLLWEKSFTLGQRACTYVELISVVATSKIQEAHDLVLKTKSQAVMLTSSQTEAQQALNSVASMTRNLGCRI